MFFLFPFFSLFLLRDRLQPLVFAFASSFCLFLIHPYVLALVFLTSVLNFFFSRLLFLRKSRFLLLFSISVHILTIIFFKNFFSPLFLQVESIDFFLNEFGVPVSLGLSYYSLQAISYLIDLYFKKIPFQKNFLSIYNYLSFFPKFIQGPIENPKTFFNQMDRRKNEVSHTYAIFLIFLGFLKKGVVADTLEIFTFTPFDHFQSFSGATLFLSVVVKGLVLYFNFFGTMDIARGLAFFFGIHLSRNFFQPFFSSSLLGFWRNWHRTFFQWMSEYVFLPLSQLFRGFFPLKAALGLSLLICFLLSGLWHGLQFNFLLFALFHAVICLIELGTHKQRKNLYHRWNIKQNSFLFQWTGISFVFLIWNLGLFLTLFPTLSETQSFILHSVNHFLSGFSLQELKQLLSSVQDYGAFPAHFYTAGALALVFLIWEFFEKFHPQKLLLIKPLSYKKTSVFLLVFLVIQFVLLSPHGRSGLYLYSGF